MKLTLQFSLYGAADEDRGQVRGEAQDDQADQEGEGGEEEDGPPPQQI